MKLKRHNLLSFYDSLIYFYDSSLACLRYDTMCLHSLCVRLIGILCIFRILLRVLYHKKQTFLRKFRKKSQNWLLRRFIFHSFLRKRRKSVRQCKSVTRSSGRKVSIRPANLFILKLHRVIKQEVSNKLEKQKCQR